ncbi:hypothetical protein HAX54_043779 [Datura stramonium]|uniref:Uncharacterized protein n=1 Tax=Datura stramonium TaxID=4076 RepID=A0ABS8W1I0_DATST|nr:hypothetical protein [Datura stramonium]
MNMLFSKAIERNKHLGIEIDIRLIKFPAVENGLPEECERLDLIPSDDKLPNFFKAVAMMQEPLEQLIEECRPNCLVSDMFLPWTTDTAAKFNIPRIVFHGICKNLLWDLKLDKISFGLLEQTMKIGCLKDLRKEQKKKGANGDMARIVEQFFNEKLVTGFENWASVGSMQWNRSASEG